MKKLTLLVAALLLLGGCADPKTAIRTLESAGYSEIQLTGSNPWVCGQDDFFSTKFVAKNPIGNLTTGTVCSGLIIKGGTIRH